MRRSLACGAITVSCLAAAPSRAANTELPADLQIALIAKILSFDRQLAVRAGAALRLVVLYQERYPASLAAARDLQRAFAASASHSVGELPMSLVLVPYVDAAELTAKLRTSRAGVLYVAPLRATDLNDIVRDVTASRVLMMTSTPGYVERGVAVGLELRGGRPLIRINLPAARAQGADFSSHLLKLAEVIER